MEALGALAGLDAGLWIAAGAGAVAALLLAVLMRAVRPRREDPRIAGLADGQAMLAGALTQIAEAQIAAQARLSDHLDARLGRTEARLGESLSTSAARTAHGLGALTRRLEAVDRAQARLEDLSGGVAGLAEILGNKQARGAFGEMRLMDIVADALPPDAYTAQATLSNGRRVDCLIRLPDPPGAVPVDSKFPLEAWQALREADGADGERRAAAEFRAALKGHVDAIAARYVIEGETADCALLFLPSEAVFAEAHARFPEVIRHGFEARVWIVSPTTLMAVLNTMRGLMRDARLAREAGRIRAELAALARETERIAEHARRLDRHLRLAGEDMAGLSAAAGRAGDRAGRLERAEFRDADGEARAAE